MSILTVTTRADKWLEKRSKHELVQIILNNWDKIDIFAPTGPRDPMVPHSVMMSQIEASVRASVDQCARHLESVARSRQKVGNETGNANTKILAQDAAALAFDLRKRFGGGK